MAIYRLMQGQAFRPEDIERLTAAYKAALKVLQLQDRDDPLTEIVARRIIETAQTGVTDPAKICDAVIRDLSRP